MSDTNPESGAATSLSLLARVREQDNEAWSRLSHIYGPLVYRWCRRAGIEPSDAADILQEVFRAVASGIERFRYHGEGDSFRGWLFGITRNKIYDHFREAAKSPKAVGGTSMQQQIEQVPAFDEESIDSFQQDSDRSLIVRQTLASIEDDFAQNCWRAFWLTTIDQRPSTEVANELCMTANAVRQAKFRVLKRLRLELEGLEEIEFGTGSHPENEKA